MPELPSGTVTFLFTDLEGSTRLWEEFPEAMRPALARHDEIVRSTIEGSSGQVVKTTGDGFHAVFSIASDAIDAAVAAQLAISGESWAETGPLRVRMGVHTGAAELRDGDYYSSAVNRAARLMSVAHGGQIVVSSATSELLRDSGVELFDLGEHRLRDLSVAERVFEVRAPGLSTEFPPLRSLDAFPGNLPRQLTSFVGRHEELVGTAKALDEWRLVTLTGTGGVGKTRLAVQVAAEVLPRFRDGAWLCELAVASDGETMAQVVAAELGVSQRPGMSLEASINDYLRPKELLLVLDNCEQLLGPVSVLAENVLRECPGIRVLATSREGLAVGGEHVRPVRSLPLPDAAGVGTATNDAVRLFVERAEAARASFGLDASNVDAVGEICRRLDGIPLAIELAAARTVALSPADIATLLDERFRLLTGGRRTAVERHQTLRATVDWSYSLLESRERLVFDRLGVFAGSFDAVGATAVVADDSIEAFDVLDALTALVAKSMVVTEDTPDGHGRFRMLETLRQYAQEQLDQAGDTDQWRRRHAEYFATWAEEAGPGLEGPDELAWRAREVAELDNLRTAVMWSLDRDEPGDIDLALRIVGALASEAWVHPSAGIAARAEQALSHGGNVSAQLRYAVTAAAGTYEYGLGNYARAQELARAAIGDGVPLGAPAPGMAHVVLATSASVLGQLERGMTLLLEAARLLGRDFPDSPYAAQARALAAMFAAETGDPIARTEAERALHEAREIGNPTAIGLALLAYGWALTDDDAVGAVAALDESIMLCRQGANPFTFGLALTLAAGARAQTGDLRQAARDLREGIERCHQTGTRLTFFISAWFGIQILVGLERVDEGAIFDGIASTGLTADWRAAPGHAHRRAAIAQARAAYGRERYDAAVHTGAAMAYDQAVEHTLRALDDLINETADHSET